MCETHYAISCISQKNSYVFTYKIYHGLSEDMFHFLGEFLVAVTWEIGNRLLVF